MNEIQETPLSSLIFTVALTEVWQMLELDRFQDLTCIIEDVMTTQNLAALKEVPLQYFFESVETGQVIHLLGNGINI